MANSSHRPSNSYDLDITIISAKHLKNVNWRNGPLKPYCIFWVDPDRRLATKSDDYGSTKPSWNEQFILPLTLFPKDAILTLEIFHAKPSDTPKPLVGTICVELIDLLDSVDTPQIRKFDLHRPSGRAHGRVQLKLALRRRILPNYQITPPQNYYYSSAPPPPSSYRGYTSSVPDTLQPPPPVFPSPPPQPYQYGAPHGEGYSGYYQGYYSQQPPRPRFERQASYGGPGPSAPVDYTYDQKRGGAKAGWGTGLGAGAVAGAFAGMALDEGVKYEEDKISERVESEVAAKENYGNYGVDY